MAQLIWINAQNPVARETPQRIQHLYNGGDVVTAYEKMYLAMVIVVFVSFGIVLATMSYREGSK